MPVTVTHPKVLTITNSASAVAAGEVVATDWNAPHTVTVAVDLTTEVTGILPSSQTTATAASLTVGVSSIASGTNGRVLYDNSGTLGELAVTGSGNAVLATSPTLSSPVLTTPALGVPSSLGLANATGLPLTTGVTGTLPSSQLPTALGTPSSLVLTNATGLPLTTGVTGTLPSSQETPGGASLQLQYNSTSTFAGVSGSAVSANGSLTIGSTSAIAASDPPLVVQQTWGSSTVVFTGIKENILGSSQSATGSLLVDLQVSSGTVFNIDKTGAVTHTQSGVSNTFLLGAGATTYNRLSWNGTLTSSLYMGLTGGGAGDNTLYHSIPAGGSYSFDMANSGSPALSISSANLNSPNNVSMGTTANRWSQIIVGTIGGAGNVTTNTPLFDGLQNWNSTSVVFQGFKENIVNSSRSAAGSLVMDLQVSSASKFNVDTNGIANINLGGMTVAALPTPSASYKGARALATDSSAATFLTTVSAGGGANIVPVFCDGTAWKIG